MVTLPGQPVRNPSHLCEDHSDGSSSLPRVFNFQKFGQAYGRHHKLILCGAGFLPYLPSALCLNLKQGGNVLGNGTWVNVGGNQAVTYGGATALSQNGDPPYNDPDGGQS